MRLKKFAAAAAGVAIAVTALSACGSAETPEETTPSASIEVPALDQSSAEGAVETVLQLIALGEFEAAADGIAYLSATGWAPLTPELGANAGERIHAAWEADGVLDEAATIDVSPETTETELGEVALVAPGLGESGADLLVPIAEIDGEWFISTLYAPRA